MAGRTCSFTIQIFNTNAHLALCSWVTQQDPDCGCEKCSNFSTTIENPLSSHLPVTSFVLYTPAEQTHLIVQQRAAQMLCTENCWVRSFTGSQSFTAPCSHQQQIIGSDTCSRNTKSLKHCLSSWISNPG